MIKTEGSISISKVFSGDGDRYMSIQIRDKRSRLHIVEVNIPLEEFMETITGLAARPCELKVYNSNEPIGKYREIKYSNPVTLPLDAFKKETIEYPDFWQMVVDSVSQDDFLDGWKVVRSNDLRDNSNKRKTNYTSNTATVTPLLERFVKDKPEDWEDA